MTVRYALAVKIDRMTAVKDALDSGTGTAGIKVYTSPMPASTDSPPTGATLLVTHNLDLPCGTVNGTTGDLELDLAADSTVVADGAPYWARFIDRDGNAVCDALTGLPGSGADVEVGASYVYTGGKLTPTTAFLRDG
jgi:hypothetical protein